MAADLTTLKASIKAAFVAAKDETDPGNQDQALTDLADAIATAIDTYAKTLTATGTDAPTGDTHLLAIS